MSDTVIKAEVFATSKLKKKVAAITPKSRIDLFREEENDVSIPTLAAASESLIRCEEPIKSSI